MSLRIAAQALHGLLLATSQIGRPVRFRIEQRGFDQRAICQQRQHIGESNRSRRVVREVHQLDAAGVEDRPVADQFLTQERLPQCRVTASRRARGPGVDHLRRRQTTGRCFDAPTARHLPGGLQHRHAQLQPQAFTGFDGAQGMVVESAGFQQLVGRAGAVDLHRARRRAHRDPQPTALDPFLVAMWSQAPKTPAAVVGVGRARLQHRHPPTAAGLLGKPQRQAEPCTATAQHDEVEVSLQRRSPWSRLQSAAMAASPAVLPATAPWGLASCPAAQRRCCPGHAA